MHEPKIHTYSKRLPERFQLLDKRGNRDVKKVERSAGADTGQHNEVTVSGILEVRVNQREKIAGESYGRIEDALNSVSIGEIPARMSNHVHADQPRRSQSAARHMSPEIV